MSSRRARGAAQGWLAESVTGGCVSWWCCCCRHALPKAYSPTDFFLRIVSKDSDSPAPQETARLDALVAAWRSSALNLANVLPAQNSYEEEPHTHTHTPQPYRALGWVGGWVGG